MDLNTLCIDVFTNIYMKIYYNVHVRIYTVLVNDKHNDDDT